MPAKIDISRCERCGICAQVCPNGAIIIINNIPQVNAINCIECGLCIQACPTRAITIEPRITAPQTATQQMRSPSYGLGIGLRRGRARMRGRGRGFGRWYPPYAQPPAMLPGQYPYGPPIQPVQKEQEIVWLEAKKEALGNRLKEIKRRIEVIAVGEKMVKKKKVVDIRRSSMIYGSRRTLLYS